MDQSLALALAALSVCLSASAQATEEVAITLEHFGVGDHFRTGETVGARFAIKGQLDEPTEVELAWELPDGSGDVAVVTRRFVLDPGQSTGVWLYARIPPQQNPSSAINEVYTVRVWEIKQGERVGELGSSRFSPATATTPATVVDQTDDLFAVIGSGRMGLDGFENPPPGASFIPTMNATTRIARRVRPADLPDRWEGLSACSVVIWSDESPQAMTGDSADALREWIRRGGVFVVVLPEAADPWGLANPALHPLSSLMPSKSEWHCDRIDAVPIRELVSVLSPSPRLLNPTATMPVTFFASQSAISAFEPFLFLSTTRVQSTGFASPRADSNEGRAIGVTRVFGHGRITIIGLDVDALHRRALQEGGLPRGDLFWNRVLARRADTLTPARFSALSTEERIIDSTPVFVDLGRGDLVSNLIGMRGQAALGILAAFLLFVAYWLVAGPGGFAVLKWRGAQRHSWLAFVATSVVFGSGVWMVGTLLSSSQARVQHLTVVDSISWPAAQESKHEPARARATCWFSAFLPGYGKTTLSIDDEASTLRGTRNRLTSWSPPPGGPSGTFPNPAHTSVPLETPGTLHVAARATAASFEAQWMGSVPRAWGGMPATIDPKRPLVQSVIPGSTIRVTLSGLLQHSLPATLRDVRFIHITPIRSPLAKVDPANGGINDPSDALPNVGRFGILSEWPAGQSIEMRDVLYPSGAQSADQQVGDLANAIRARYEVPFASDVLGLRLDMLQTSDGKFTYLDMLTMFNMLQPPAYLATPPDNEVAVRVQRMLGRSIDLSHWFTSPCLIVFGYLDQSECPVPIRIDGEAVPSDGLVVVRAMFPLPLDERFAAPTSD